MHVLVYPHDLGIGGSQLNAIEIGAAVQALGHRTTVFGQPGALVARVRELGLEFVQAPEPGKRPSPRTVSALVKLIDDRHIDVLHGYEWPPALECVLAARRRPRVAAVGTVMSMAVAPFIPTTMPLMVGTAEIAAAERDFGRPEVHLLEPPVDLRENDPGVDVGQAEFRTQHRLEAGCLTVGMVTRMAYELKLEGILAAIQTVEMLAEEFPIRLVIAGDGPARAEVIERAATANARAGAGTVLLLGELLDPRTVYATADVLLGMGGSALRAMAFAKPLVVQGEHGFWRLLDSEALPRFLWTGWYGVGDGAAAGSAVLAQILRGLHEDPGSREFLGGFGRRIVEERFSTEVAASTQLEVYSSALGSPRTIVNTLPSDVIAASRYTRYYLRKRLLRARGLEQADDFNARPIAATRPTVAS
jgi:glycosyltransferase involved in cell wall biosynthesis